MDTYVLGDIHGAYRALLQVLERSPFRPGLDRLVQLGDVADGWPDTPECVNLLLSIPKSIWLQGNHDWWLAEWMAAEAPHEPSNKIWLRQGGQATVDGYLRGLQGQIRQHFQSFFSKQLPYYEDKNGNLFVHGGYEPNEPIAQQDPYDLIWNRALWRYGQQAPHYSECFIGHTPTWPTSPTPCQRANVWNLDQGAGYSGRLTLMNVRTKEYVQSDPVPTLYPGVQGR
ncbi:serine/threonine protein phosphatase [Hymenobacter taeanensis]|uniref:Serine/threonine protein phosphatase n=1 Tax=Hymenobacter taeanensis TaxID=2735321 RepID=A0A6M6BHV9_9BACT|nr:MULTISPECIES: metallophosphoesterase [Hymenobacter]QJX47619.1 serine/threonine protein phosphatase [Hymenobacter taeanensis]UOQ82898.1 metallophosphoesterase [Hymenobacter sp. 5414T-23]